MNIENVKFDEKGLVPAIVQDAASKEVLTLAYMNKESLEKTLETKETWFYSRSRQELWHKGATSGNTQKVVELRYDCDQDAFLVLIEPQGPACHTGAYTCFNESVDQEQVNVKEDRFQIFSTLEKVIAEREAERPEGSYTTYLFDEGVDKILKKVGEEASEVIIAAKNRDHEELKWEVADLFFHTLVLLREQKLPLDEVLSALEGRHKK
ncbi:bifunctional phosphoribosyl-AMP cyclohydrolase/phosphoribosyl-ATP diphosphatase HisIE [Metabacillus fastidiosus]|uniref:bifunctional phosphoribosyl-AMP cyclohydrolase/phosphoribosyl-ATP diphosphatase HisIE n=1 Tax=Metabacillus fastidiosus TaxID=1458 RepID=UPI002E21B473|nr:bifunctional phosphoribosyl-AMP cyclohydrolase/phosphoribosyl-ATP diphosphatase HisIE [Metabacillus fastidiosus]MED4534027.1 bifunctional phosphoribosyl-AMP cyclohydrolase/phosphoribosyl-ATP diphosphatase HisIE [Metabacillus fastidiosus]